jgi:TM2 domain-containing membrane protein YozV
MKQNPIIAGLLSLVIPGMGQIYRGEGNKGALILAAAIVIGNLNIIILPLISIANPVLPPPADRALWAYWIPRIVHDILALWSIAFWIWAIVDAYIAPGKNKR